MTKDGVVASIRRATTIDSLDHLTDAAYSRTLGARGGQALLAQLWGSDLDRDAVRAAVAVEVAAGRVWVAQRGDEIIAGALVGAGCVRAIWVQPAYRRYKVASTLLSALATSDTPPQDAWALPGDRATKSLYESVGWKARLLTMRGA